MWYLTSLCELSTKEVLCRYEVLLSGWASTFQAMHWWCNCSCVPEGEVHHIISYCCASSFGDHVSTSKTKSKVLHSWFFGLACSRMFTDMLSVVLLPNMLEIFQGEMTCTLVISLKWRSSTYGALILWALSHTTRIQAITGWQIGR